MMPLNQEHSGSGGNFGGGQVNNYYTNPSDTINRPKYLNNFAHYDLANLVGRERQLKAIEDHFAVRRLLLLHGIGGIGKTTLAKAYISQATDKYDHIAYVEILGSIVDSILFQLGASPDIGLQVDPALDAEGRFEKLMDILRHIPKLLLVLDNANDTEDLRLLKRQLTSFDATVLITGRAKPQLFIQDQNVLEIPALTPDEALGLFKRYFTSVLTEAETSSVHQILTEAFYHPKLVEVIAKAAHANVFLTLEHLVQIVGKKHYENEEINYPVEIDDKTKKIFRVLLDLFNTDLLSENAQQLLRYFAIFPNIDVDVKDLAKMLGIDSTTNRQILITDLNCLVHAGWLDEVNNRLFSMHGLIQWVVRQRLSPTADNCMHLIKGMANVLSYEPTEIPLGRKQYLSYTTEWLSLFADDLVEELATTFGRIGIIYWSLADYEHSLAYDMKSLSIRETVLSPNHPDLAKSYLNLASTFWSLGDYEQSLIYDQMALSIRELTLPVNDPDLAQSYNSLAVTYGSLKDYAKCLDYHQKALIIRETVLQPKHPDLAKSYNNLAETYGLLGDHQQRLVYHLKALNIRESVLAADHPDLARSYNNLAATYGELGNRQQCLAYVQKALAVREVALPPNHPELASSHFILSVAYYGLGDFNLSLESIQKAISIQELSLPINHPALIRSKQVRADIEREMQDLNENNAG